MMYQVDAKTSEELSDNYIKFYKEDKKVWISIGRMEERGFTDEEIREIIYGLQNCINEDIIIGRMNEPKFILREILEERNITSQALADKTGIPKQTIDQYRSGRRKEPTFSNGLKIAQALSVDPRELIKEDTD